MSAVQIPENGGAYMIIHEPPDYLSFVDEDIRQMFDGKSCLQSDILMAQLIKELRILNKARTGT